MNSYLIVNVGQAHEQGLLKQFVDEKSPKAKAKTAALADDRSTYPP